MFSFHKPKIYRSNLGCCICKAKSSSSRFTDSKKYENEFEHCFRLKEKRSGEICNACVLLVKRWKKLSLENRMTKHWHHVVDARAGPGTKLTGNRRLSSPASQQRLSSSNTSSNPSDANDSSSAKQNRASSRSSDVLPLSSTQVNNQSNSNSTKARSLSKVCAIDTNVSTFTFGEPIVNVNRTRSYMSTEPSYHSSSMNSSSSSFKPQSALNSSAFESVIKRFRQRQQQQHLEAQRRQLSRQQRVQQRKNEKQITKQLAAASSSTVVESTEMNFNEQITAKRAQRYPSAETACGINSVLDNSIWRREKICCGVIFRGLHNEIAVVPRLLKPCQCRLSANRKRSTTTNNGNDPVNDTTENVILNEEDESDERVLTARATKSGSISSCDSNTSGCGSMEEVNNELSVTLSRNSRVRKSMSESARKRQRLNDGKQLNICSPAGSSSGNSSSQIVTGDDDDDDENNDEADEDNDNDGDDDGEDVMMDGSLILEVGDASTSDSSNDATSSSVESLASAELGAKQTDAVAFG